MGVGTSLGAYFDTGLDHHTGNELNMDAVDNNEWSPNEIMPHTPEPVDPSHYDTPLTKGQEEKFQDWKSKMAPNDSGEDYDLRGAFLNDIRPDEKTGHWPDTFKKPNHPTFSDESMYAGERPDLAGRWQGDVYIPPLPITPIGLSNNTKTKPSVFRDKLDTETNNSIVDPEPDKGAWGRSPSPLTEDINNLHPYNLKDSLDNPNPNNFIPIANLTNTPDEIMSGLAGEGVRIWNRGTSGPTFRRNANDNKNLQIDQPDVDASILKSWNDQVARHQRGNDIINENARLMDILNNRPWSDLERHKFNKLNKEHEELFRGRPD